MQPIQESSQKASCTARSNKLDIYISGLNFPSSSCVNLYQRTGFTRQNWVMFASTEAISGTREPVFKNRLLIQYFFSVKQEICAEIIDLSNDNIAGRAEFTIGNLVNTPNQALSILIQKERTSFSDEDSYLVVKADLFTECLDEVRLQFAGNFYKSYVFTSKTFLSLWKLDPQIKKFVQVARGGIFTGEAPYWEPIQIKITDLCEKDYTRWLRLVVHKIPKIHQEKVMGHVDFTLEDIFNKKMKKAEIIKFPSDLDGEPEPKKSVGNVFLESKEIIKVPHFLDYVFGGLEICSSIGIDFSNRGIPYSNPASLHYFSEGLESVYENVTKLFAEVLAPYNAKKDVLCHGFGALFPDLANSQFSNGYSSCFSLNGKSGLSSFSDLKLFSESYRKTVGVVEPNELRYVAPVLETIRAYLSKDSFFNSKKRYYNIILLLEEEIEDIQEVIDFMVLLTNQVAATLLLVGIGKGPYPNLDGFSILSGQTTTIYDSKGNLLEDNAIAFLSLQEAKGNPLALVKELLKFIPDKIYTIMIKNNLLPNQSDLSNSANPNSRKKDSGKKIFDSYEPLVQTQSWK